MIKLGRRGFAAPAAQQQERTPLFCGGLAMLITAGVANRLFTIEGVVGL